MNTVSKQFPLDPKPIGKSYMQRRKQTNYGINNEMLIQSDDKLRSSLSKVYRYSEPDIQGYGLKMQKRKSVPKHGTKLSGDQRALGNGKSIYDYRSKQSISVVDQYPGSRIRQRDMECTYDLNGISSIGEQNRTQLEVTAANTSANSHRMLSSMEHLDGSDGPKYAAKTAWYN